MIFPAQPFYMIRHGETDWNVVDRFQGRTDIPINFKGRQQAAYNGRNLKKIITQPNDWRFVASPLGRTRQTMEIARSQMELDQRAYDTDDRLLEITFGDWETFTLKEIGEKFPFDVARRNINKWNFKSPNGESYADGAVRIKPFLEEMDRPSVVVTHGGIIRAIRHLIEGIDGDTVANQAVPQDRIYYFDGKVGRWL
ncbi:MAG: histidine phosphatase family protein [Ahrensia sp.]|nr:histidine phosphatase family protein [Ahrensia sp.]